jgi:hypothetical protein
MFQERKTTREDGAGKPSTSEQILERGQATASETTTGVISYATTDPTRNESHAASASSTSAPGGVSDERAAKMIQRASRKRQRRNRASKADATAQQAEEEEVPSIFEAFAFRLGYAIGKVLTYSPYLRRKMRQREARLAAQAALPKSKQLPQDRVSAARVIQTRFHYQRKRRTRVQTRV